MEVAKDQRKTEKMNGANLEVRSNPADGNQNVRDGNNASAAKMVRVRVVA